MAPLGHIAARLHAIGGQARRSWCDKPFDPFFLISAHAGIKTGEDGPTHADPQPLQLLQENFPKGAMITLTPWDPQELWPLVSEALRQRPAPVAVECAEQEVRRAFDLRVAGLVDQVDTKLREAVADVQRAAGGVVDDAVVTVEVW